MISIFIFTSNDFQPWKIEEREREKEQEDCLVRARIQPNHIGARRSHHSDRSNPLSSNLVINHRDRLTISGLRAKRETERERRESREIVKPTRIAPIALDRTALTNPPLRRMGFLSLRSHHWWISFGWVLFGSWENVKKCEHQVENVFSLLFSRIQPNTRKYFPKNFLECNQTLENIFLYWKYFPFRKIFYIQPNIA